MGITWKFNQVLSWDSSVIFMEQYERRAFWENIERCLLPGGRITVAWNHFLYMAEEDVLFMNREEFRSVNHHFRGNAMPSDFKSALQIFREISRSNGYQEFCAVVGHDSLPDSDVMSIPYFDLIDPACFSGAVSEQNSLKGVCLSATGIDIVLNV